MTELEPVGYGTQGEPLYQHQIGYDCDTCATTYPSAAAASECCGRWDGRGWD